MNILVSLVLASSTFTTDCAPASRGALGEIAAAVEGACNSSRPTTVHTRTMPAQSPESRIGGEIFSFLPRGATKLESVQHHGGGRIVTRWDVDADGVADAWSTEQLGQTYTVSLSFTHTDGTRVDLWGDANGRVNWEQRWREDGSFANGFDRDGDGALDDLRVGRDACGGTTLFVLAQDRSRNAGGYDPSTFQFPHAIVPATRPLELRWDEQIERASVRLRLLFSEIVPPPSREYLDAIARVQVADPWVAGASNVDVSVDAEGITIVADGVKGSTWYTAPFLDVWTDDGARSVIGVVVPRVRVNDTAPELVAVRTSITSTESQLGIHRTGLGSVEERLTGSATLPTSVDQSVARARTQLAEARAGMDATRFAAAAAWNAAGSTRRGEILRAIADAAGLTDEERRLARNASNGGPLPDAIRDLAYAFVDLDGGFAVALQQARDAAADLAYYEPRAAAERAAEVRRLEERAAYHRSEIEMLETALAGYEDRLDRLQTEGSIWEQASGHEPYVR